MCGRYTLTASPEQVQQTFLLDDLPPITPRYNIAPSQAVAIITSDAPQRVHFVQWGLVPSWAKDTSMAGQLINARGETLDEKPSFKGAFKVRRCLVPADGFYEWRKDNKSKFPQYIHFADKRVFAMAGLWEEWNSPHGDLVQTCTIITTEPNELIRPFHHRMAVILHPDDYATWLDKEAPTPLLKSLLGTYPADDMAAYEVSPLVNNAKIDTAELIRPYQSPQQGSLL